MKFGPVPLAQAQGAILAHGLRLPSVALKKGRRLTAQDVAALDAAGLREVVVARAEPHEIGEDEAAARIAAALAGDAEWVELSAPFTGRANLFASAAGLLRLDAGRIAAVNALHEAVTLATLPDLARVAPRQMLATVKIIPYAAPAEAVAQAEAALAGVEALRLARFGWRAAHLTLTATPGMKPALLDKGAAAVRARLGGLGLRDVAEARVAHETGALAQALRDAPAQADALLILTGSATSDRADVGPAAVAAAGGRLIRFGMPVDPGNLLFLGELGGRPVIGLPGCARSPALNGADWVLERLAAGLTVGDAEIAAMGVGGLLKEIPSRPAPRAGEAPASRKPFVVAALLAAGASRRMRGRDKLLEEVDGAPILRRAAQALLESRADATLVVLGPDDAARRAALAGLDVAIVENPQAAEGMASSLRAALAAAPAEADALVVALGDMPEVGPAHVDALIAAFSPEDGRAICRAITEDGAPGHPVLFGRRFFETLARIDGDQGARELLRAHADLVENVPTPGRGAAVDLDTPEAWEAWRAATRALSSTAG
ncbi:MAG: molybdopterin-binding/glycosyltransferase family 2 protein [Rubrimonas sp.]|uniref:molybdopterin-binding/glycosyltransferase family 2 protein n=1 Tax=Rubrimonas sp. TaxID=2036015 RepID=UPI002FDC9933